MTIADNADDAGAPDYHWLQTYVRMTHYLLSLWFKGSHPDMTTDNADDPDYHWLQTYVRMNFQKDTYDVVIKKNAFCTLVVIFEK